jgi:LuxR family transcriptional regulator of csgAB operon
MIPKTTSGDKELAQLTDKVIHIIGPRRFQNGLMVFFLEREIGARCIEGKDVRYAPNIGDRKDINQPKLFNVSRGLGIEEKALKRGVRGFFYEQEPLERFTKGVHAIFDGELWVSRGIMTKTILKNRDRDIILKKDETILTPREIEILTMVAVGAKNEEIADELFISPNTVRTHIYNIFKKIDVPNRLQAALWAAKNL